MTLGAVPSCCDRAPVVGAWRDTGGKSLGLERHPDYEWVMWSVLRHFRTELDRYADMTLCEFSLQSAPVGLLGGLILGANLGGWLGGLLGLALGAYVGWDLDRQGG